MNKEPLTIAIPEETLTDLRERLARTRWPRDFANDQWQYGTNSAYLKELVEYWLQKYDWRKHEREINTFSHYRTTIEGMPIHFIHQPGKGPKPMPILLNHGWPWTFWDLHKVIRPLADPAAFGGDPADAFDVVVPSLPGYGFSSPLNTPGINYWCTADLWVTLMQDVLGYKKFAAQGGDWGAAIVAQLGHKYADRVIGIHTHMMFPLNAFAAPLTSMLDPSHYGPEEKGWYERSMHFFTAEAGYVALQTTKPQTLAYGLNDSPAGLCAWILEKRRTWSGCDGDVEKAFTKDELLTVMTLYWVTQSFGSSARYYYEAAHNLWQPSHNRTPVIEAPTAVAVFPKDIILLPRTWAERYYNLKRWTVMPSGGHFAAMEEPQRLVNDIRAFFRSLRG
jgi:pimeloyl-ACP methyl ester carboxylesterase